MWYAGGGTHYYSVDGDLLGPKHRPLKLKDYFSVFDAVVEHQPASSVTNNDEHKSLISWYADGTLKLRGMYLSHNDTIPYLILTPSGTAQVEGFGLQLDGKMAHFRQEASGEYTFAAAICKQQSPPAVLVPTMYRHTFLMPQQPGQPPEQVETYVFKSADFSVARPSIVSACRLRDEVPLSSQPVESRQLLSTLRDDQVVRFYQQFEAAADARWGPEMQVEISASDWPERLQFLRGSRQGESYLLRGQGSHLLAKSDMDEDSVLMQAQYSKQTAPGFVFNGLRTGDRARSFQPRTTNDHLATDFYAVSPGQLLFFSLWVNWEGETLPSVSIQDDEFDFVAYGRPVARRPDGWVLVAGWAEPPKTGQVRLVVEPQGHDLRVDKLLLLAVPRQALAKKRDKSVR